MAPSKCTHLAVDFLGIQDIMTGMRIALAVDCFSPIKNGVVTSVRQLKDGLEERGHSVLVLTVRVPGAPPEEGVVRIRSVPAGMGTEQRYAIMTRRRAYLAMKRWGAQLVHTHTEFSVGSSARKAARLLGIPAVHTNHTMWEDYRHYILNGWFLPARLIKLLLRRYLNHITSVVAPSVKIRNYVHKLLPDKPIQIIPNGVDRSAFAPRPLTPGEQLDVRRSLGIGAHDPVLIFVGRMGKEKRVDELVTTLAPVLSSRPGTRLLLVGDGPRKEELVRIARALGVEDSVILTGFVPWESVYRLYSISDLYVTTSLSEVHPMTLIEAAMCGVPGVARRDESYMTLIHHGENGYLAQTDAELRAFVERLIDDAEMRSRFREATAEIARIFTKENHVRAVEDHYRTVLSAWPRRPNFSV
jgi:1,2-diacylglycerol 3-alpha-glucosyltransferase